MKKKVLALCMICLFGFGCAATSTTGGVSVYRETDKFTGETTIYSTENRIGLLRAKCLYFSYSWKASEVKTLPPPFMMGAFQQWGHRSWKYLENHDLTFLADGISIPIPKTSHNGVVDAFGNNKLAEYVYFTINWPDFLKLCDATKVEYKLGAYEHKIKSKTQTEMRALRDELFR